MATPGGLRVRRLATALGAEVSGISLAECHEELAGQVRALLLEHSVLFFPEQHLDPEQHVAFGRLFGPLEAHPNLGQRLAADTEGRPPEMFELAASRGGIADEWHTDLTFLPQPSVMSILQMKRCPEVGGDTCWTSLYAAYEALSEPLRELLDGLTALHDARPHNRPDQTTIHPVVRVHPETGRKVLYVNEHFTRRLVELSGPESDVLLDFLTRHVQQPRFTVRYRWSEGTVAMWDNRCTQHFVLNDFEGERVIQRVTVMGDLPEGEPARWTPWPQAEEALRRSAATQADRQLRLHLEAQPGG